MSRNCALGYSAENLNTVRCGSFYYDLLYSVCEKGPDPSKSTPSNTIMVQLSQKAFMRDAVEGLREV